MKLKKIKEDIIPVLRRNHIRRAAIFGSVAKKKTRKKSDVDLLVEFESPISLLEFVRIKHELEDTLGKKVDMVEYSTLKPLLRDSILNEQIQIL